MLTLSSKLDIATITDPNDAAQRDRAARRRQRRI